MTKLNPNAIVFGFKNEILTQRIYVHLQYKQYYITKIQKWKFYQCFCLLIVQIIQELISLQYLNITASQVNVEFFVA